MRTVKTSLLLVSACAAVVALAQMGGQQTQPAPTSTPPGARVGAAAPMFTATDTMGRIVNADTFRGRWVVLEWFNPECPFVKKHYVEGHMQKLQAEMAEEGIVWITVNSGAPGQQGHMTTEASNKKAEEWKMAPGHMLIDESGRIGRMYGATRTPHMFVIDPKGTVIYAGAIDSDSSADPKKVDGAENFVVAAIKEAKAGKPVSKATTSPYGCTVKYAPGR